MTMCSRPYPNGSPPICKASTGSQETKQMLTRKIAKTLVRVSILLTFISILVFIGDLFLDFLPSSLQTRLPLHPEDPVLVDVRVEECWFKRNCAGPSSSWKRIDKDLYLGQSWTKQAYVFYREIPEPQLPPGQDVVVSVATGPFDPKVPESSLPQIVYDDLVDVVENALLLNIPEQALGVASKHGWRLVDKRVGLWLKYAKHQPNQAVTKLAVVFGHDAEYPLPHWTLADNGLNIGKSDFVPRIAFRKGRATQILRPPLRFDQGGRFKIVQIADPHMSTGYGECDHPVPDVAKGETCLADVRTNEFVDSVLDEEEPDLVVFSGDQIFGPTAHDPETALLKSLAPAILRKIPFSVVWGNHDDQGPLRNSELMDIASTLPYSLAEAGPADVPGDSNYYLTVSPYSLDYPALTLYFVDSHNKLGAKQGYDWIKPEQHEFLRASANTVRQKLKGYSHIPMSMAFFHIPVPEYGDGWGKKDIPRIGEQREGIASPNYNSGTLEVLRDIGVSVVGVGHDHVNDFCQLQPATKDESKQEKVLLCYGGGVGWGAYGGYPDENGKNFERRIRVFEIDMNVPTIETWHRIQDRPNITNHLLLVDNGKPTLKSLDKPSSDGAPGHHRNSQEKIPVKEGNGHTNTDDDEDDE